MFVPYVDILKQNKRQNYLYLRRRAGDSKALKHYPGCCPKPVGHWGRAEQRRDIKSIIEVRRRAGAVEPGTRIG